MTETHKANCVDWIVDPTDPGGLEFPVWVTVSSIDRSWANDTAYYVGPNGTAKGNKAKYEGVGRFFSSGSEVHMVYLTINPGHIAFTDGRHRFAWLRDHGTLALPVMVPSAEIAEVKRLFGTRHRTTYWLGS